VLLFFEGCLLDGFWLRGCVYFVNAKAVGSTRRNGFNTKRLAWTRADVNAATITRQSKSNLALAFISLGRERKRDITVFYAFCRVIDDIADSSELSVVEKRVRLAKWRQMLHATAGDDPLLARDVRHLIAKYSLPVAMLEDLARFHYSETELTQRHYNEHFVQLMEFQARRARQFFDNAAAVLPAEDRKAMAPAEIMGSVYRGLLRRIELDKFRVFEKEYR